MKLATYTRFELLRTARNVRFLVFSLVFPLLLFFLIAGPNRHATLAGVGLPLYFMGGMIAFGTMMAVVSSGGRIAVERQIAWNRQLRLTPLRPRTYIGTKVLCGYALAGVSILVISLAGTTLGVRLSVGQWATMIGLVLVALLPFAGLGIALGHLLSVDSLGPAMGGITSILATLGGAWGPVATSGALATLSQALPSYWLAAASRTAITGTLWPAKGWIVIALWSLAMARLALWSHQRDTKKA